MKQTLFNLIGSTSGNVVRFNMTVGEFLASAVARLFNLLNFCVIWVARLAMNTLDEDRLKYVESVTLQQRELGELHLLNAATKVKDDALSKKMWTAGHTVALNRIAANLHYGCGWEPPRIHQYLREVVESIPGVVYTAGDDLTQQ